LPVTIINKDTDEKIVYCQRHEPITLNIKEYEKYYLAGAEAYEIYVICADNKIESINYRIAQLQCSHHSHAPNSAPAWIFPEGAMFDIKWEEIILSVRKRMLSLLEAFINSPVQQKKSTVKRTPKAVKEY